MERNDELRQAWDFVENTGRSIFLTGKAGTGKSKLIEFFIEEKNPVEVALLAPTGIAADNVDGNTLHSYFRMPLSPFDVNGSERKYSKLFRLTSEQVDRICQLKTVIIDEISMVRCDILDAVDYVLRRYRCCDAPFGGVQIIMFGDLYQLPPVVKPKDYLKINKNYESPFFFLRESA